MSPADESSAKDVQVDFLAGLRQKRFLHLQKACGARQGNRVVPNQLIDAFHIWCAESAAASHFLTNDFKLIRAVRNYKSSPPKVKLVKPSELLADFRLANERGEDDDNSGAGPL
jgi:hypothetical protein